MFVIKISLPLCNSSDLNTIIVFDVSLSTFKGVLDPIQQSCSKGVCAFKLLYVLGLNHILFCA